MAASGRAVVNEYWSKLAGGDIPGAMALMAPDVVYTMAGKTPVSGTFRGMGELTEKLLKPVLSQMRGLTLIPDEFIGEGDRVAVIAHGHAKTPSGESYENRYVFVYGVRGGKIAEVAEYLDTVEVETKMFGKKLVG